ncbi:MAG TPA: NfeD family protein [Gammaproteobacteria bacterium]|nr:NfeD family protein [Gammaproteobacteria bacterium]
MSEILGSAIGILVALALLWNFGDAIGSALAAAVVAVARWVQKVVFGIDRPLAGADSLIGRKVQVQTDFALAEDSGLPEGYVVLDGERWRARSAAGPTYFSAGERLSVLGRQGLVLLVGNTEPNDAHRSAA